MPSFRISEVPRRINKIAKVIEKFTAVFDEIW